ncbi:ferritin-like domain-containing protein [Spirosoma pomorum]
MEKQSNDQAGVSQLLSDAKSAMVGRRLFMRYLGTTAAAGVALSACTNQLEDAVPTGAARAGYRTVDLGDLGSNDVGILNYAYALEQLEAAFYTRVMMNPYSGMTEAERVALTDIRDHEIIHRELFKAALASAAIPGLTPDFTSINFSSRASVLGAAALFEKIGVSAYNGAGQFIKSVDYLLLAGKIVSVEARHAAIINALLFPDGAEFAGDSVIYPSSGLEEIRVPGEVLTLVAPYVYETINAMPVKRIA